MVNFPQPGFEPDPRIRIALLEHASTARVSRKTLILLAW